MLINRLQNNSIPELKLNDLQIKIKQQISSKIEDSVYQFEDVNCPVCESKNEECVGEKDRYGLFYKSIICTKCGLLYVNPRMNQASYNEFYNLEYRKLYGGAENAAGGFFNRQQKRGAKLYKYLEKNNLIKDNSTFVLEVGCGAGGILSYFKSRGHKVKGTDLGQEYVEYGKKQGLDLQVGFLSQIQLTEKPDIIIYSHVLEHVLDLNAELETIKKSASKDTIIFIEVPGLKMVHKNYQANILNYFQNAHTYHFSLESLSNLFSKHGFELICGDQYVQSVFRLATTTTSIKNDYEQARSYILRTEKRRNLFPFTVRGMKEMVRDISYKILKIIKFRPK